jgi:predicted PurR-regulated permease PerM
VKPWVRFAGGVLVVTVLYWAQAVLVPFALAVLLAFVLTPPATWLQRWVGRVPAVLLVVSLVFASLGFAGWGLALQMDHLAEDLPGYRANIRTKIADVRLARQGSAVQKLMEMLEGIRADLDEVALAMLAQLLNDLPITMEIAGTRMQAAELVSLVRDRHVSVVCFADLQLLVEDGGISCGDSARPWPGCG